MGFFLLLLLGVGVWFFVSGMAKAKARMAYADDKDARRIMADDPRLPHLTPTWYSNRDRVGEFTNALIKSAQRGKYPVSFVVNYIRDDDAVRELMHYVALLEERGSGFLSQQSAAVSHVQERFFLLPVADATKFQMLDFEANLAKAKRR
nr:hypothetical protein [uncultured Brevundimonas sp.]